MTMRVGEIVKRSNVPGLAYKMRRIGGYRYLEILHKRSGKPLVRFTSYPVKNASEVMRVADILLAISDWTVPESEITMAHASAVQVLKSKVVVEQGYYMIKT